MYTLYLYFTGREYKVIKLCLILPVEKSMQSPKSQFTTGLGINRKVKGLDFYQANPGTHVFMVRADKDRSISSADTLRSVFLLVLNQCDNLLTGQM